MKKQGFKKLAAVLLTLVLTLGLFMPASASLLDWFFDVQQEDEGLLDGYSYSWDDDGYDWEDGEDEEELSVTEDGWYDTKDEVALYIHTYGHLPDNYITKKEAEKLGWDNHRVRLDDVAPGKSIGGSRFGNYEGLLPDAKGRTWTECDIDASNGVRGVKRIVFSNDGLIYYTEDHYETFEKLY